MHIINSTTTETQWRSPSPKAAKSLSAVLVLYMSSTLPGDPLISALVSGGGEGRRGPSPKRGAVEEQRGILNDEGVFEELEMEG